MTDRERGSRALSRWGLQPGRAIDLGWVDLRQDAAVRVRVVGIRAKGHREPWRLATNRSDSLARVVALYDRQQRLVHPPPDGALHSEENPSA